MSFINWGHEDQEQKNLRRAMEERELFEQALQLAYARSNGSLAGAAAGSGGSGGGRSGVYYVSGRGGEPWDAPDNLNEMTAVFGENWTRVNFEDLNFSQVFSPTTKYVFIEGGDEPFDLLLRDFMLANGPTVEEWVAAGGKLFINAAGQEHMQYSLGFGGVVMNRQNNTLSDTASISNGAQDHPIFAGPGNCGSSWTGESFAHALLSGDFTPLITSTSPPDGSGTVLCEKTWGSGKVIFGTMTLSKWQSPKPEVHYLHQNIHAYLSGKTYTPQLGIEKVSLSETTGSSRREEV